MLETQAHLPQATGMPRAVPLGCCFALVRASGFVARPIVA